MRILLALFLFICSHALVYGQYFQQGVDYRIEAELDTNHVLTATTFISYTNNAKESLDTIYLHLWMNAFSDKLSAFSEQSIRLGMLDFYYADKEQLGGYSELNVKIGGQRMELYSWNSHKDIVYFLLPKSLKEGEQIKISTSYSLKLPKNFSRTGYKKYEDYLMYWYPTPAVYDQEGWHPMPYLGAGEFYTEIANFDIQLTTEANQLIASTPFHKTGNTYDFKGEGIIDFAIITSKNKNVFERTIRSGEGRELELKVMTSDEKRFENACTYLTKALTYFEQEIGPFPYSSLSIMDKGAKAKSGMEYPGLITVSGTDNENSDFEYYLVHELLHQYFYSALAFNQRDYAWLDEGLTTYYQQRYYKEILGVDHYSTKGGLILHEGQQPLLHGVARGQACRHYHAPLSMDIHEIDPVNYGLNAYEIPARMYAYLQDYLGDFFDTGIQVFYTEWKEKHPKPDHLRVVWEEQSGKDLAWFFEDLIEKDWSYDYALEDISNGSLKIKHKSGSTPPIKVTLKNKESQKSIWIDGQGGEFITSIDPKWEAAIIDEDGLSMDINRNNNSKNISRPFKLVPLTKLDDGRFRELYFLPTVSYNTSDGAQLGLAFYNSSFPTKKLKWALSPAYAFGSKSVVGEGWISYDHYLLNSRYRKLQYKLNAKSYAFRYAENLDMTLRYSRVSPHVSLHFHHDTKEHKYSKLYVKSIFLNEEFFRFEEEDLFIENQNSTLFRIGYEYYNFWELGPSDLNIQLEYQPYTNVLGENHSYTKLTMAYNKAFKYAPSQSIDFRLWGSYFITNTQRESANFDGTFTRGSSALIYQGFNDYAYDDYFFNRSNQGVSLDNQISQAGGGFKTPLGSQYNLGQTNDFAFALNVKSDLPIKFPKLFPLKLFLDIGHFRGKSIEEENLKGSTIYSGGFMLEYGEGLFSIHLPLFNSQAISDIYDTEGIGTFGRISFKIDLIRFNPWDIAEDYSF